MKNKETGSPELCFDNDVVMLMGDRICNKLLDIGEGRLKDMDANGIDVQVLSLTAPGLEALDAETGYSAFQKNK